MDEELHRILTWASHGTLRQFQAEIGAKLAPLGYEASVDGDKITCFRVRKEGGFLGIGARKVREPMLTLVRQGAEAHIEGEPNAEFVQVLAGLLKQH